MNVSLTIMSPCVQQTNNTTPRDCVQFPCSLLLSVTIISSLLVNNNNNNNKLLTPLGIICTEG